MSAYYGIAPTNELSEDEESFFDSIVEALERWSPAFLLGVYSGNITPGKPYKKFYDQYLKSQIDGIRRAFGSTKSDLAEDLMQNVNLWSGAKSHQVAADVSALLFSNGGVKLPFKEFKDLASPVLKNFNSTWLKTEYQTAILQSGNAKQWDKFEAEKEDFPLLQYKTVKDKRVRDDHEKIDGVIKPVNDPFWAKYMPQNGWGCRCRVKQLESGTITKDVQLPDVPKLFLNNAGVTGHIYDEKSHPYFKIEDRYKQVAKDNFGF